MEYQKTINLLGNTSNQPSKFKAKYLVERNYESRGAYNTNSQIKFKTTMLNCRLSDYSEAYILVKWTIAVNNTAAADADANNLIEYSDDYSKTSGSLWQYCKDIPAVNNNDEIVDFGEGNLTNSFNFKVKMTGQTGHNGTKSVEIIKCEINLNLGYSFYFNKNQGGTFAITETKLYGPVVTLSTQDNECKIIATIKIRF